MNELFNETYYQEFCLKHGQYDIVRPLRRALRQSFLPLPPNPTLSDFAIGFAGNYLKWRKLFVTVYGYDINQAVIEDANRAGLGEFFFLQDVTIPFEPEHTTDICTCYYLFEHVTDQQCLNIIANMVKIAPVNIIGLTPVTDKEHYDADPTHSNPKTIKRWSQLIKGAYDLIGWKRIHSVRNYWCYGSSQFYFNLRELNKQLSYLGSRVWDDAREQYS